MPHKERRTPFSKEYDAYRLNRLNNLSNDYPPDLVFNMDETRWRRFERPTKVLAENGAEMVKLRSKKSRKAVFTAIGTISVTGQKFPFWVVAKRTMQRCERKFGTHPNAFIEHADSGWTTENLIVACIEWLHYEVAKDGLRVLILDIYPSHRTDLVVVTAEANDMELFFVHAGAIGRFQPLDRRIFGELKAPARVEFGTNVSNGRVRRWL
jgi:hypothetical protein